jgi:hypothetical protein
MYSTKTATTNNTEFNSSYMPVGINENVTLSAVNVMKSPQGRDYIEFIFTNAEGQTASFTEWKNEKNMWIKTDEDLQRRDDQQFGRIIQVINCFYSETPEFEGNNFVEMINWVKSVLENVKETAEWNKYPLRLKVVYDKNGYTRVSSLGTFVEPMSVEQSQIKLWKKDLLERPVVADNETAADPFAVGTPNSTSVTETNTGADDLPF